MASAEKEVVPGAAASVDEVQQGWNDLTLKVSQLETQQAALEQENKALRFLLERVIEHRQKSHNELILLLTSLVSRLPINDVGVVVARLVEHNAGVTEICAALMKGKAEASLPQPSVLKALDQTKRDLLAALKPAVEELIQLDPPFEPGMLRGWLEDPESFFTPAVVRANRCFVKGQVPRERVVKEFGEGALAFFNDMTTDAKLNPRPKPEEIVLAFKPDFEALLQQNAAAAGDQQGALLALYQRVQRSKAPTEQARAQRTAFQRASFILELLHYYANQSTEAPEGIFAQRLPVLVEQLVVTGPQDPIDEKAVALAESLLAFILNPDHRFMVINNIGKGGGSARTLKYVLRLRADKSLDQTEIIAEFVKHLIPPKSSPDAAALAGVLRLVKPETQRFVAFMIMDSDRLRKEDAQALAMAVGKELGLVGLDAPRKAAEAISPEVERQLAWEKIKEVIMKRGEPNTIAAAMRDRLHARYDAEEIKQSWITLTEADVMSFIRIFCQLPYLADGRTDPIARPVMETYVSRLTHEKYASTYNKVVISLRNMFNAKPDSPTLVNFLSLVRWVDPAAANKLSGEIGMPVSAH